MWTFEHSVETPAEPAAIWRLYTDVSRWPTWNNAVEQVRLNGPFTAGATGELTPTGQEPLPLRIADATENTGYVSETEIADTVTLRLVNTLTALPNGRTRITHRAELVGPAADHFGHSFGPALTAGIPRSVETLAALAERED
ncbi:SRPBCC family protein [Nocardia arthritidis]|uniref:Polyketide cyclase n=1 Tax=Nocardia arthritidis TaxID=228602 RepID=A0A6G9YEJ0_9NOCA|nr:SRPBCC family protein [Nocardia arthritidis]QIS11584.1 polyketide cyclase [Nocardia arthritidis]